MHNTKSVQQEIIERHAAPQIIVSLHIPHLDQLVLGVSNTTRPSWRVLAHWARPELNVDNNSLQQHNKLGHSPYGKWWPRLLSEHIHIESYSKQCCAFCPNAWVWCWAKIMNVHSLAGNRTCPRWKPCYYVIMKVPVLDNYWTHLWCRDYCCLVPWIKIPISSPPPLKLLASYILIISHLTCIITVFLFSNMRDVSLTSALMISHHNEMVFWLKRNSFKMARVNLIASNLLFIPHNLLDTPCVFNNTCDNSYTYYKTHEMLLPICFGSNMLIYVFLLSTTSVGWGVKVAPYWTPPVDYYSTPLPAAINNPKVFFPTGCWSIITPKQRDWRVFFRLLDFLNPLVIPQRTREKAQKKRL